MKAVIGLWKAELRISLRNGEQLLVAFGIPVGVLVFFSQVEVFAPADGQTLATLAPGVLALAVMSASLVSLGVATGFERYYGVLRRLGATPLGRGRWVAAKVLHVLTLELGQWAVLVPLALALGWDPTHQGWGTAIAGALLGTLAFAGIGLLLAGTLPGLTNLAAVNGLYLLLLLTSGMSVPDDRLPAALLAVSRALPAAPLTDVIHAALTGGAAHPSSWPVLGAWAVAANAAAIRWFRWT